MKRIQGSLFILILFVCTSVLMPDKSLAQNRPANEPIPEVKPTPGVQEETAETVENEEQRAAQINAAIEALVDATRDPEPTVRNMALKALERIPVNSDDHAEVVERIAELLIEDDPALRQQALDILMAQDWDDELKGRLLYKMLEQKDPEIVHQAADSFRQTQASTQREKILALFINTSDSQLHRHHYSQVLASDREALPEILPALEEAYQDADSTFRIDILTLVGAFNENAQAGLPFLAEQTKSDDMQIRLTAIQSIYSIMTPKRRTRASRSRTTSRTTSRTSRAHRDSTETRLETYVDALMERYDTNRDDKLDATEIASFSGGARLLDNNRDGSIDRNEILESYRDRSDR